MTIGANVKDFHKAANITKNHIEKSIRDQSEDIAFATSQARKLIEASANKNRVLIVIITLIAGFLIVGASIAISMNITRPLKRLTAGAVAMSQGELDQSIEVKSRDEIGELARAFNGMAAAISEVDRMKSEFVTIASHELRTPIHAMLLGVSGVLEGYSGEISEDTREDLELAKEGIERLTRLVEGLLDISRIEARKVEFNIATASVTEITDAAIDEISDLLETHRHVIIKAVPENMPDIEVDKDRIIQVMVNLLSNSIKYSEDGGKIIITAETEGKEVVFSVADNGYGIPSRSQKKVFEKFFQADSIMSQKVGGSGLGLTITKGIIEEHNGAISCESPVPEGRFPDLQLGGERKGTIFVVRLPTGGSTNG